jgi:2-oxoglutarate ferredoxin oxidoreductase subunit gamma
MTEKSLFAGSGGQGIVLLGQVWAHCAMTEGKNVTVFPFYGAEKRGGVARSNVIASDEAIASPLVTVADSTLAMSESALAFCEAITRPGGLLVINATLVAVAPSRADLRVAALPLSAIADGLGNGQVANMVALGALARLTGVLALNGVEATLKDFAPKKAQAMVPLNVAAIRAGWNAAA